MWSRNFDSGHFWSPQNGPFLPFLGYQKWHFGCPNQNSETTFRDPNHPQNPHLDTLGTFFGPRKVIFGHFVSFAYFYLVFPLAQAVFFFKCPELSFPLVKMLNSYIFVFRKQNASRNCNVLFEFLYFGFLDPPTAQSPLNSTQKFLAQS